MNATALIAGPAHSMRARCQFGYKRLTRANFFGYTPATPKPSRMGQQLQNTVAGFRSPMRLAAQSRNTAQVCGFFVRAPSFGGSDGRAQALPVNGLRQSPGLRTRSSCLPHFAVGVAVVHLRQLEATMVESLASLCAIALVLSVVDGKPTTTSLDIARHFNRPHGEVMRRIRTLLEQLPADHQCNFALMLSEVAIGSGATRQDPAYRITRDGFTLLAMGFTGKKALQFKLAYIDAFNKMEAEIVGLRNSANAGTPALPAVKTIPRRPSKLPRPASLPPEVQPLVDATVWRMVGRAHTDIADWVERHLAFTCNLDHTGTANTRAQRAAKALEAISYEDWLTQGELNNAKNLLVFFEVARDLGAKGADRINTLIKTHGATA